MSKQHHSEGLSHPKYRPDIDGLRAVAVLSVVVFHAFPTLLPGGFIGVDIFFVISGYLISTIIFENLDAGRFSFREFYARRIKRIFPALLVVLVASIVFGWLEFTAPDFKRLGKHIVGGAGFLSNFVLVKESGYFDAAADIKPLLHLWSLAIEEQFYIIWPLLAWCAWKLRVNRLALMLAIGIALFVLNVRSSHEPSEILKLYYSPATRFWELLIGALLAYLTLYRTLERSTFLRQAMERNRAAYVNGKAGIGVVLLVCGLAMITEHTPFPGWYALLPTMGAALFISAGTTAWINRTVLANRILVWFGLISFPLYLWHWPLLSFARILETSTPSIPVRIGLVALSIVLAWLTKVYLENPIRLGQKSRYTTLGLVLAMMVVAGAGAYVYLNNGMPGRYGVAELKIEPGRYECADRELQSGCRFGNPQSGKLVVVWGDSHAEQYTNALRIALGNAYQFLAVTNGSCFMGDQVQFPQIGDQRDCGAAINKIRALKGQNIYAVIRVQRWHGYGVNGQREVKLAVADAISAFDLHPQKIIIMGATPNVDIECELSNYYTRPMVSKKICRPTENVWGYLDTFAATTRAMTVPANVHFIYPADIVCPNHSCQVIRGNVAYFEDIHHLTTDGALRVVPAIARVLDDQSEPAPQAQSGK